MKFDTECNKYKNFLSYLTPVDTTYGNTTVGLFNKYKTVGLLIRTFWSLEMTTLISVFTINYRIVNSKNDTPLSYLGNSESEKEEINIVYSSDKELETNQVINEGIAFLSEFKYIMDNEDVELRNKQLEVFIKKHKIEEDFR